MIELDEGSVIGNYRVVRLLGQGGMGTVYEVEHLELGTHYALKTFTFDAENDSSNALKTKFLEEGKLLARLKHPNLTHVFDLGFEEKTQMPYFVMDLVVYEDGETYTVEDIDLQDIDEDLVYKWFGQLASALDYIHGEGIVHRDIKPCNLLVDKDLNVVLTDFGISRIFGAKIKSEVEATRTMVSKTGRGKLVLGTEHYIAPEVAAGEDATPQADAYALGVMLLRWLTGFYYGDNPGAIALLSKKKFRWLSVISQLVAPAGRRPECYGELVDRIKPNELAASVKSVKREKAKKRKAVQNLIAVALGLGITAVLGTGGYYGWRYLETQNAKRDQQVAALQQQMREKEAAEAKAKEEAAQKAKEDEEKRIAEEKTAAEKAAAERKAKEDEQARIDREKAERQAAEEAERKRQAQQKKPDQPAEKPSTSLVFGKDDGKKPAEENLGPIPDRQYKWLANDDPDRPNRVTFDLANGAKIELVPMPRGSFFMSNTPDQPKNNHKVTLTRPFWFSRTLLSVDQWREFSPNDYEECREIEKALGGSHPVVLALTRKSVDDYCTFLSRKYRKQLPKGYVFRLPSEAELEYVADVDATRRKYDKPGVKWWGAFASVADETAKNNFKELRMSKKLDAYCRWNDDGWVSGKQYGAGCLALPNANGICDLIGWDRHVLDILIDNERPKYADEEIDPLRFCEWIYDGGRTRLLTRNWIGEDRRIRNYGDRYRVHIVVGPDLIGEQAWKNAKTVYDVKVKIPQQVKRFDPKKIKNKITKPQEIRLRRVGGSEMVFCEIPKGRFNMSNVAGQSKLNHRVDLTYPFWMSKSLVTTKEWREYAPNDFQDSTTLAAERNFSLKYPICVPNKQASWRAYCAFLNERYKAVLPPGYVFRLPTEAEWEWAFIADDNNNIRNMRGDLFNNECGSFREKLKAEYKQKTWPANIDFDSWGRIGRVYVGGRTSPTGFGIMDIVVGGGWDIMTLDNYDVMWRDGDGHRSQADPVACVQYSDKEINPLRSDGCRAGFVVVRHLGAGRRLMNAGRHCAFAHIVIAPDLETPMLANEKLPYPAEDFGGKWLGDKAKRVAQSSKHDGGRNTDERIKRMLSLEQRATMKGQSEDLRGFQTQQEDSPWIMLELDKRRQITGLVIESWDWSTRPLRVWVSDDGKNVKGAPIASDDVGHKCYRFDLRQRNVTTKYLVIGRKQGAVKDWFWLDKVLIYGNDK